MAHPARFPLSPAVLALVVLSACGGTASPSAAPSSSAPALNAEIASYQLVVDRPARLAVALVSSDRRWLSQGSVRLSFAYAGDGRQETPPPGVAHEDAIAGYLPIPGTPGAEQGAPPRLTLPADGRGLYAVDPITFTTAGFWQLLAQAVTADGSLLQAVTYFQVLPVPVVLSVGDFAPRTENPVIGDPGVEPQSIDSRAGDGDPIPDPELHTVSIAEAIDAGHPALVVFSTPVYCVSQFCGPVTDLVAELAADYSDRADFIHVEIYEDFTSNTVNQAALDWLLTESGDLREPWTFLIDADGRIAGSWDTVVTRGELEPLLSALPPLEVG